MQDPARTGPGPGLIANLLILLTGAYALLLWFEAPDTYYTIVQEDELLEWASFWAFAGAGIVFAVMARKPECDWRNGWFPVCLSLFCLFVAMEEISWAQRVIGYRPPAYFLEFNYQQELNLHNVVATELRKLGVFIVIFGYGVLLPVLALIGSLRRRFEALGVVAPPAILIPAFLVMGVSQQLYPIKFTGEWIEMMLGTGFLFAGILNLRTRIGGMRTLPTLGALVGAFVVSLLLGALSAMASDHQRVSDRQNVVASRFELNALHRDFTSGKVQPIRCGFHKRVYSFVQQAGQRYLFEGEFARLVQQGLPEERAEFFLDPWNYAYWIRDNCATDSRRATTYLYSFGPNRRRESTRWEIRGDDIAVVIIGNVDFQNDDNL